MPVFNKMVYNGTEYILGGGGNIGEPLNLTVTTSGLDATITWEDNEIGTIPPTTFQKSELVRKIGSAPTSPSDGVLVVTETVKDTYKTTGYVDQGLTDGETYYYRVFSYSDLGGISYCDAVNVTPSAGGWQPGANTIVYYPLDTDFYDASGNGYDMTGYNSATIGTLNGVNCLDLTANQSYLSTAVSGIPQGQQARTNMFWVNFTSLGMHPAYTYGNSGTGKGDTNWNNSPTEGPSWSQYGGNLPSNTSLSTGQRVHVAITIDGSTEQKIYINGEYRNSSNNTVNTNGTTLYLGKNHWDSTYLEGYLSKFIIEDKIRTAQEIQDYFDLTKGNYGIS